MKRLKDSPIHQRLGLGFNAVLTFNTSNSESRHRSNSHNSKELKTGTYFELNALSAISNLLNANKHMVDKSDKSIQTSKTSAKGKHDRNLEESAENNNKIFKFVRTSGNNFNKASRETNDFDSINQMMNYSSTLHSPKNQIGSLL